METTRHSSLFWTPPSWVLMGILLIGVLYFKMVLPLISGLVLFVLINQLHLAIEKRLSPALSLVIALCLGTGVFLGTLSLGFSALLAMIDTERGIGPLMIQLTDALNMVKHNVPLWLSPNIPDNAYTLLSQIQAWLISNTDMLADYGKRLVSVAFRLIVGAFVGLLVAIRVIRARQGADPIAFPHPYLQLLLGHIQNFVHSFQRVFFAQFYIALVNTIFTGFFLGVVMPLMGLPIPFLGMLLLITFVMGFIPIIGNLVSNTAITLTALSISPLAAILALLFLIIIHKLEYFLNAWIVGTRIKVRSYELLISMLCLEAVFGMWGLVLAPAIYSYVKEEFASHNLNKKGALEKPPVSDNHLC